MRTARHPLPRKIHNQVNLHACKVTIEMHEGMYVLCVIVLSVDDLLRMIRQENRFFALIADQEFFDVLTRILTVGVVN